MFQVRAKRAHMRFTPQNTMESIDFQDFIDFPSFPSSGCGGTPFSHFLRGWCRGAERDFSLNGGFAACSGRDGGVDEKIMLSLVSKVPLFLRDRVAARANGARECTWPGWHFDRE